MVRPRSHTEVTGFACPWVHGDLVCPQHSSESGMTQEENRLVLRHSGSSSRGRGQSGHEGVLVVQEQRLLGLFTSTIRAKSRGNAVFLGFATINGDTATGLLSDPSAPAPSEHGTSPCGLNGKCCQLNPNAVSRALIKPMYQVWIKPTHIHTSFAAM